MSNPKFPSMAPPETESIEIVVNGERQAAPLGSTLASLLQVLELDGSRLAIELNRQIVRKDNWNSTTIRSGDELEIVQFVGGG